MSEDERMDEWCLVELMGHRRHAARVREVEIAGAGMLRLDEPSVDDGPGRTLYVSPSSVYALHPTTEEAVRMMVRTWRHEPVQRWELPAATEEPSERTRYYTTPGSTSIDDDDFWAGPARFADDVGNEGTPS